MHRPFKIAAMTLLPLVISFSTIRASATPDSNSYWKAARTAALVDALKKETPSTEIKNALLNSTRAEDRDFAKALLIQWKKSSKQTIEAEFDRLILKDLNGTVVLVIQPIEGKSGSFRINGGEWTMPEKGSISQSLKKYLAPKQQTSTIFDLVTPLAYASDDLIPATGTSFVYAFAMEAGNLPSFAQGHLNAYSPRETLLPTEGGILTKIVDRIQGKSHVQCAADSASGRMVIDKQPVDFIVNKDGSMVLKPIGSKSSLKVESSVTPLFGAAAVYNRDITFTPCLDTACEKTTGHSRNSMKGFLKEIDNDYVNTALTFRPRDAKKPHYPIEFACEESSECNHMEIRDVKSLSAQDRKWAIKYRDEANAELARIRSRQNADVLSIRPLYACCQDKACKTAVLNSGIELKNAGSSKASGTNQ